MGDICISYLVGALWTLAFESPIITFEKIIFGRGGGRKRREESGIEDVASNSTKLNEPSYSNAELTHL